MRAIWSGSRNRRGEPLYPGPGSRRRGRTRRVGAVGHRRRAVHQPALARGGGLLPPHGVRGSGLGLPVVRLRRGPGLRPREGRPRPRRRGSGPAAAARPGRQADHLPRLERRRHLAAGNDRLLRGRRLADRCGAGPGRRRWRARATSSACSWRPAWGTAGGGPGPDRFDALAALERWVELGEAPARIVASRVRDGAVDRTRPLCPYPEVARWNGRGSTDEAENFACVPQPAP